MTSPEVLTVTGSIAIAGTASCLLTLVLLHVLPTGLSPLTNPVSQYGITSYRLGYRIQTIAMGIAAIAAAIGISKLSIRGGPLVVVLLVIFGAARLAISWFPMDVPGAARTESGRRHGVLALAAFGGATLAALRLGTDLSGSNLWVQARGPIAGLGIAMLVSLISMGAARRSESMRHYFGLVERAFYAGTIGFLFVVAIELVRTR
ncbi:MAG: DUF998 domain-containing protein [Acidimicrobiales bacterium]